MDEMILVEYISDANLQKKPISIKKWIETERVNEIISLKSQNEEN